MPWTWGLTTMGLQPSITPTGTGKQPPVERFLSGSDLHNMQFQTPGNSRFFLFFVFLDIFFMLTNMMFLISESVGDSA